MPTAFDRTNVLAALRRPCVVDEQGNLYALREDHAIVNVAGPALDNEIRFWANSRCGNVSWAASTHGLFVHLKPDIFYCLESWPDVQDKFVLSPDFSRAHYIQESQDTGYLLWNTYKGAEISQLRYDHVKNIGRLPNFLSFGGWVEEKTLNLIGMRTRELRENSPSSVATSIGKASIVEFDVISGRGKEKSPSLSKDLSIREQLRKLYGQEGAKWEKNLELNPRLIEAWLACFNKGQRRIVVGSVVPAVAFFGHDDSMGWLPAPSESESLAILDNAKGPLELEYVLCGYGLGTLLLDGQNPLLYVFDERSAHLRLENLYVFDLQRGKGSRSSVVIRGVERGRVSFLRLSHEQDVGYYGLVSLRSDSNEGGRGFRHLFVGSHDGISWDVWEDVMSLWPSPGSPRTVSAGV